MTESYRSGYYRAMAEHIMLGPRAVKRKALNGVDGASVEWMQGYRQYSRLHVVVRRYEDSMNHM